MKKTAQQIQDEIFRKMPAERKIKLVSSFWEFAKQLSKDNFYYKMYGIPSPFKKNN